MNYTDDDDEDGGQVLMEQTGGQQEDRKIPTSVTPCGEGTELVASTGHLLLWMPAGLLQNLIPKGNGKRFVSYSFVPSAGADSGESFAAILENRGEVLNLRQKVPNLALELVRFHHGIADYDTDNFEISTATAQITKMYAAISLTHATPEIW